MKIQFGYDGNMDLLNALETFKQVLPKFGVEMKILDGGDGYEEVELTKKEEEKEVIGKFKLHASGNGKWNTPNIYSNWVDQKYIDDIDPKGNPYGADDGQRFCVFLEDEKGKTKVVQLREGDEVVVLRKKNR